MEKYAGNTMVEGSDDLSRLSNEDLKTRSRLRGSRGQPATQMKKRRRCASGMTTRSSGASAARAARVQIDPSSLSEMGFFSWAWFQSEIIFIFIGFY